MPIKITIKQETIDKAINLVEVTLPSTIKELWGHFQDLGNCLWQIRDEINAFVDSFPTKKLPHNFRYDDRFDDNDIKKLEITIEKKMDECSLEVERIIKEKQQLLLIKLKEENDV